LAGVRCLLGPRGHRVAQQLSAAALVVVDRLAPHRPVAARMQAAEERGHRRESPARLRDGVLEHQPFGRQAVERRRPARFGTVDAQGVRTQRVDQQHEHVRRPGRGRLPVTHGVADGPNAGPTRRPGGRPIAAFGDRLEHDLDRAVDVEPEVDSLVEPAPVAVVRGGVDEPLVQPAPVDGHDEAHAARALSPAWRGLHAGTEAQPGAGGQRGAEADAGSGRRHDRPARAGAA